ncbi:MAG: hypothetical protein GXY44_07285 [Phycisphaerales bacterium]|nr:hypothetical protein [Phycisphaerales bacterium]
MAKLIITAMSWLAWSQVSLAQDNMQDTAVPPVSSGGSAMTWLIGACFIIGTLVVAFKPAKRSNLQ